MSRIGRKPINIPAGVDVKLADGVVTVKGPKGTLTQKIHPNMTVTIEGGVVEVTRPNDEKLNKSLRAPQRVLAAKNGKYFFAVSRLFKTVSQAF